MNQLKTTSSPKTSRQTSPLVLGEILSNMAFIHRAVAVSYSRGELFLSIRNPRYVHHGGQAWFRADLPDEHTHGQTLGTIPNTFRTTATQGTTRLESVARFAWSGARRPTDADILALKIFHRAIRLDINYISSVKPLWYFKKETRSVHDGTPVQYNPDFPSHAPT